MKQDMFLRLATCVRDLLRVTLWAVNLSCELTLWGWCTPQRIYALYIQVARMPELMHTLCIQSLRKAYTNHRRLSLCTTRPGIAYRTNIMVKLPTHMIFYMVSQRIRSKRLNNSTCFCSIHRTSSMFWLWKWLEIRNNANYLHSAIC